MLRDAALRAVPQHEGEGPRADCCASMTSGGTAGTDLKPAAPSSSAEEILTNAPTLAFRPHPEEAAKPPSRRRGRPPISVRKSVIADLRCPSCFETPRCARLLSMRA